MVHHGASDWIVTTFFLMERWTILRKWLIGLSGSHALIFVEKEEIRIWFLLIGGLIHSSIFNVFDLTLCCGFDYPMYSK